MNLKKYDDFKKKNYNTSFLMNKFIFQNNEFKNFFISQEKTNYDFYYFLGKNENEINNICQIGLCCGYFIGMFLLAKENINNFYLFDTSNNNKQILRLTKNNLLFFKNKNFNFGLKDKEILEKISYLECELLIIFDSLFYESNIEEILNLFEKNKFTRILILDNLKDDINFENKIKNFSIIRNMTFEKYIKRNNVIALRKK